MRKVLIYWVLIIVSLVEMAIFVTATSYVQLLVAIVAYPVIVYCVFKALPRRAAKIMPKAAVKKPAMQLVNTPQEKSSVADIDRRGFLKLIGTAGVSFFLFSLFNKRAEVPFLAKLTGGTTLGNNSEQEPTSSYRISEIDSAGAVTYYGFVKQGGAWFIMQEDTGAGSFRYTKGEAGFPGNWVRREQAQYDYYHNVF